MALTRGSKNSSLNLKPCTLHPQLSTINPQPVTLFPQLNPQPLNCNPKPQILNPKPSRQAEGAGEANNAIVECRSPLLISQPQSSELGTYKTVEARFWPWPGSFSALKCFKCFEVVASSLGSECGNGPPLLTEMIKHLTF